MSATFEESSWASWHPEAVETFKGIWDEAFEAGAAAANRELTEALRLVEELSAAATACRKKCSFGGCPEGVCDRADTAGKRLGIDSEKALARAQAALKP